MRVFGRKSLSHVIKECRRKHNAKAMKCIFISYCYDHKDYKFFYPCIHKIFARKCVLFHELVDEGHKEDKYDAWHIPCEYDDVTF